MQLIIVPPSGEMPAAAAAVPEFFHGAAKQGAQHYKTVGYTPPWVGYIALVDGAVVGGCGFKGPPATGDDGVLRVEIAYLTLPEHEGAGHATAMACELVRIASETDPAVTVAAQTLREEGPSTTILRKQSFTRHAELIHPEDGEVGEWRRRQ